MSSSSQPPTPPPPPPLYPPEPTPLPVHALFPASPPSLPPQPTIDPRRLQLDTRDAATLLGRGSFGAVYRGVLDGAPVAVKVVRGGPAVSGAGLRQFQRELRRYERFRHPCIAQFYGVVHLDGQRVGLVTELCEGGDLFSWLKKWRERGRQIGGIGAVRLATMIASGLYYLHEEGFTFGDLKSLNVLLTEEGGGAYGAVGGIAQGVKVKLCDFGLSRRLVESGGQTWMTETAARGPVGTLAYLAPEAFKGQPRESQKAKAVDIYALGVVLYELCTQVGPWLWEGVSTFDLEQLVVHEHRRPAWPKDREVPQKMKDLIERCWHQDPAKRPVIKEVLRELEEMHAEFVAEETHLDDLCRQVTDSSKSEREEKVIPFTDSLESGLPEHYAFEDTEMNPSFEDDYMGTNLDRLMETFTTSNQQQHQAREDRASPPIYRKERTVDERSYVRGGLPSAPRLAQISYVPATRSRGVESMGEDDYPDGIDEIQRVASDITSDEGATSEARPVQQRPRQPLSLQDVEAELRNFENQELDQLTPRKLGMRLLSTEEWHSLGCR